MTSCDTITGHKRPAPEEEPEQYKLFLPQFSAAIKTETKDPPVYAPFGPWQPLDPDKFRGTKQELIEHMASMIRDDNNINLFTTKARTKNLRYQPLFQEFARRCEAHEVLRWSNFKPLLLEYLKYCHEQGWTTMRRCCTEEESQAHDAKMQETRNKHRTVVPKSDRRKCLPLLHSPSLRHVREEPKFDQDWSLELEKSREHVYQVLYLFHIVVDYEHSLECDDDQEFTFHPFELFVSFASLKWDVIDPTVFSDWIKFLSGFVLQRRL